VGVACVGFAAVLGVPMTIRVLPIDRVKAWSHARVRIGPKLANGITTGKHRSRWMVVELWSKLVMRRRRTFLRNLWREQTDQTEDFISEDEGTARTMCITAFGHA